MSFHFCSVCLCLVEPRGNVTKALVGVCFPRLHRQSAAVTHLHESRELSNAKGKKQTLSLYFPFTDGECEK